LVVVDVLVCSSCQHNITHYMSIQSTDPHRRSILECDAADSICFFADCLGLGELS
jgi:hypothetical protein